ncbi:hypothetical protein ACFYXF_04265 [Streptomyces sp. NPDC002680]|uniref:S10 family serine carboxypeptidase-like protein n=1 Tax=Streptomyces sp. NPDC002680 TaxID=3364659 RepID=UPI0036CD498A
MTAPGKLNGVFGGREITYTFSCDEVDVRTQDGRPLGTQSVFSYIADHTLDEPSRRPVLFAFNGGPGSSSAFLHLSGIGPRRVAVPRDLSEGVHPPYLLEDSPNCLLDVADLVFIDPLNAGFGRSVPDADLTEPYSIEGDARLFAEVITDWITRHDRWDSPKFLMGESYGTHRAPFVATQLHGLRSITVDGLIFLGQALNVQETLQRPGNPVGMQAALPFYAAAAWFHGRGSRAHTTVDEAVDHAVEYAHGEFGALLLQGNRSRAEDRRRAAAHLEEITGIEAQRWLSSRFSIKKDEFRQSLLEQERKTLGMYDARYVSATADSGAGEAPIEAALSHLAPAWSAGLARHLRQDLGLDTGVPYRVMDVQAPARWSWHDTWSQQMNFTGQPSPFDTYAYVARLTQHLRRAPRSRLFIGTGHYDALTTVGAVEHLLRQYDLPEDRVVERRYPAGHMPYADPASLVALTGDLRSFICLDKISQEEG